MYQAKRVSKTDSKKRGTLRIKKFFFIAFLAFLALFSMGVGVLFGLAQELPRLEAQTQKATAQTSKLYDVNGKVIAGLHAEQNRVLIPLDDMPDDIKNAVIAIEDERFYKHIGFDPIRIIGALLADVKAGGRPVQGASTITQQYAKNMFLTADKTIERKLKELLLAYQLERRYNKDKILEKYLNTIYFGAGCYGIETASEAFFGKPASQMSLAESALLAGVIKAPNTYSPYKDSKRAKERRDLVLTQMRKLGFITKKEEAAAKATPIKVYELKMGSSKAPYFVEYVKQSLLDELGENAVFKGGLEIYTTLDLDMQTYAEEAILTALNKEGDPSAALVAIEPKTGYIKALVGGKDFSTQKYNLAIQGIRQPGSSFKTFVLTAAIDKGCSPSRIYESGPITFQMPGQDWNVTNYDGGSKGPITIRQATILSVNGVYARLIMDVGPENVVKMAKEMGIKTDLKPYPSIALGAQNVSPLEMASAYATLANEGVRCEPIAILKVLDSGGKVLKYNSIKQKDAVNPATAYLVTNILQDVIRAGTGRRASIGRPAAGKTGTAQRYQDAWFVGYTPDLAAAVWVGHPEGSIPMRNVHGIRVTGGSFPAQIWGKFMSNSLADTPKTAFAGPKGGVTSATICPESGFLPNEFCPNPTSGSFVKGTVPTKRCKLHVGLVLSDVAGMREEVAVSLLTEEKFLVKRSEEYSEGVEKGRVISQSPAAGTTLKEGSEVKIVVSLGPEEESG
ncbi:MAG: PBP1A family penicillin-binding protein [Actinomycetota bacterium]|nr:PBP1A family penicillin-binding protein [Actinomycetota bacterium]